MEKIVITATAESYEQARELLELGVDRIYIGEKAFGLRRNAKDCRAGT